MKQTITTIGRSEQVSFPELNILRVSARIDTGARTSSIWASDINEADGILSYTLFDEGSEYHNDVRLTTRHYNIRTVASSNGQTEQRYAVILLVEVAGRKIRAHFTLANRSTQAYPVLVGRNVLRGKFLVDVKRGHIDSTAEHQRSQALGNTPKPRQEKQS